MEDGTACLSDFGLSGIMSEFIGASNFSSTVTGNIRWGAPELFAIPDNQEGPFIIVPSKKADIYSFGSVMLQVCHAHQPPTSTDAFVRVRFSRGKFLIITSGNQFK